jgi:hypothetical protein
MFNSSIWLTRTAPNESRIAVAANDGLFWIDMDGNVLWSSPLRGFDINISNNGHILRLLYQERVGDNYFVRTTIMSTVDGQALHTFQAPAEISGDGNRAIVANPEADYLELYDFTTLFP